ncbi:MAG: PQQ-binding-like beta-propeller repeat protein, partial [Planctomycetales bacterium]|nr:PQQ-binding-like beta-propeller repeat protein [Planctomycetales bacterium]
MRQRTTLFLGLVKTITLAAWVLSASRTWATDWPTWRFDTARSATTTEQLPDELHLQWSWQLPQLQPAWPEDERLEFDAHYEPVVAGGIVFVASPLNHSVSAYDLQSGDRRWRFFADGPVRFAPVCANGRVYVGADDGCLYCLAAESGNVLWKFKGAPSNRMVIGNERLISVWPVRGAPFLQDGKLYFTIGVWPFEGTLLYEVDAETGRELRVIDLDDHSPQGYLATNGQTIVIPGGRSRAFLVDITSGTRQPCSYDSKGLTDYHVAAHSQYFFHGDRVFPFGTESPVALELTADRPVVDGNRVVFVAQGELQSYDIDDMKLEERTDRRGEKYNVRVPRQVWKLEGEPVEQVHLKAGGYVYAHHANQMIVVESAASAEASPRLVSKTKIDGTPASMIAADQHLVVVTKEGRLLCMGKDRRIPRTYVETQSIRPAPRDEQVAKLVRAAGTDAGYCLVVGAGNPTLLHGLADQTEFHTIVIDNDRAAIGKLREEFSATGQYGSQIVAIEGDLQSLRLPPYFASLVVCEDRQLAGDNYGSAVYSPLRPYGGVAAMVDQRVDDVQRAFGRQANADVREDAGLVTVHRAGALPGSANWTHEYGDPANSLMSQDDLVMSPLGLLWYGGPSSDGSLFFDRHDWPPSATIIDGRMFIQGPDTFAAIDVYTGRVLWKIPLPAGTSPGRRSNWGSHGYHFVAESDGIYLTFPERCYWLSPETGNISREFTVDDPDQWGRIRVVGDTIVAPLFREVGSPAEFVPAKLVALNRHTGEKLWQVDSEAGFPLVAIGNNKVFVYEGKLDGLYVGDSRERRRGLPVRKSPTL